MTPEQALRAEEQSRFGGARLARRPKRFPKGVYLLTSAQNNTHIHKGFWRNLLRYARHRNAEILVSQFTYDKRSTHAKPNTEMLSDYEKLWYCAEIEPYVCNDRIALASNLIFCGEVNIIPTAERPLSGFENYTGRASGIFPHAKQAMDSIASTHRAKFNYTTGTCTLRNYVQKKAGLKAEHLHCYGALVVEVTDKGWWVRQIQADDRGDFQDWDVVVVKAGKVTTGNRVEAVQWGDIHVAQIDPEVRKANWGDGGIMDTLRPRYQFMHDTLDFLSRNHHAIKNPHEMFIRYVRKEDNVQRELWGVAELLKGEAHRDWCKTVVVESNHDAALTRWLREADYRDDPANALFFLKAQTAIYQAIVDGDDQFSLLAHLMRQMGVSDAVRFLDPDESFVICKPSGGVECGLHGHNGVNGSRGSPRSFARLGRKTNTGHVHAAGIIGDCFTAGTSSKLRLNYNRGPSSWSHSHIVTYASGARAIVTVWQGQPRG